MGLFDNLQNLANSAQELVSETRGMASGVMPQGILNLQQTHHHILQSIEELEAKLPTDNSQIRYITSARTQLMSHYGHLMRGGEPEPVAGGKLHPIYKEVASKYQELDSRLHTLEEHYQGCTFGYQMPDGSIAIPTMDWTEEQWEQMRNQSKDQVARCWVDSNPTVYV